MSAWEPEVVFIVLSSHQTEDAWCVAKALERRALLVGFDEGVFRHLPLASLSNRIRTLALVPNHLNKIQKEVFYLKARALIKRLTRRRPFPVFVFGDDVNSVEHSLIQYARRRKAPSALVQDGFLDSRDQQWIVPQSRPLTKLLLYLSKKIGLGISFNVAYGAGGCDLVAVYGTQTRNVLIQRGVPPDSISVTGAPRFDRLAAAVIEAPATGKPMILALGVMFAFQKWDTDETDDRWLEALNELSLRKPEWKIVLRPHPTEPLALYEQKLAGLSETALVLDRTLPIHQVLQSSHALIVSFPSTVVLEANLLQVPVVFLDLKLAIQQNDYTSERGALTSSTPENLVRVLEDVTNGSRQDNARSHDREDFLNRFLGSRDGHNAHRIAQLIAGLHDNQAPV